MINLILMIIGLTPVQTEPSMAYCINLIHTDSQEFKKIGCDLDETLGEMLRVKNLQNNK